ncbi:T6SS effector BTH_I2691 family protein [Acerihabitans sp. TG2]|uniref:T6SS effector BTH_I2691 family protein n=1 Tax=Acerihabitans sp. TG2 TaxID=3096008 RepID=UPI002B23E68C|nr:T6SS effector BTH_I2691 family protein [Acerihabitans sp. TG2]MEA9393068.1 T6SS effector BTH_I2691 family protein [Acerihabitans sp. TG2]
MSQPTPLICSRCQPCGPALLPVRYAAIPETILPKLPGWATPETPLPKSEEYDYGLRAMREGFLYVYYEGNKTWAAWSITPDGGLWKQPTAPAAQPKYSSECTRGIHKSANIEFIVLDEIALRSTVWIAFSPYKWNPALFDLYGSGAAQRKKRMQQVEYWHWTGPEEEHGIAQATPATVQTVLDYLPIGPGCPSGILSYNRTPSRSSIVSDTPPYYSFAADALRPRATLYPWSSARAGNSSQTIKALHTRGTKPDGTPIKPLIMAVHDPIGIAHELTGWCDDIALMHQRYCDELAVEFATYYNMEGLEKVIKQAEEQSFDYHHGERGKQREINMQMARYVADPYRDPLEKNKPCPEKIGKHYDEVMAVNKKEAIKAVWKKYYDQFNQTWITAFKENDQQLGAAIKKQNKVIIDLRLLWLKHPLFIACIEDFHSTETQDHLNFRDVVGYALASINLSEAGKKQLKAWTDSYSTQDNKNLLWRYQFFNCPEVMASVSGLLEQIKSQKQPYAGPDITKVTQNILDKLSVYADAVDRALSAMMASNQATQSMTQRVMSFGDRALTTITNGALKGTVVDTFQGKALRAIFLLDAGVTKVELAKMMNEAIAYPEGSSIFATDAQKNMRRVINEQLSHAERNKKQLGRFKDKYEHLAKFSAGKESIKAFRIKSLGVIIYSVCALSLTESSSGSGEDRMKLTVPLLSAASSLAGLIEEAYKGVLEKKAQARLWKCAGSSVGSIAAGITIILDTSDMLNEIEKKRLGSLSSILAITKLVSDTAFAINTVNELLAALGKNSIKKVVFSTVRAGVIRTIGILASWQVMVAITIAQTLYELLRSNDIQVWCKQTVFGDESKNHNTMELTTSKIAVLLKGQEEMLQKAIHEVFNLPPSEEEKKKKEAQYNKSLQDAYDRRRLKY